MTATAVVDSGQTPIASKIAAIASETDPNRRAELVVRLTYDEKMAVKNEFHRAEDPIFRNLCLGVLEAAEQEDRRQAAASARVQQEEAELARFERAAERAARWAGLPELQRALFLVAENADAAVRDALLELAATMERDTSGETPPSSFTR